MPTQKKIDTVTSLTEKVVKAKAIVLADYRGLKHKQLEELRKILKKVDGEFAIVKNRLFLRALRSAQGKRSDKGTDSLITSLKDTTAALLAYSDEVAPIKELLKFFKNAGVGRPKVGLLGTQVLSDSEVTRLSELPTRSVLLGTLVWQLNAPIQGLHYALNWNLLKFVYALNAVKEKKAGS